MNKWGADADQLDALAATFGRCADLLDQNRGRLSGPVHHAPWRGHEAERFRHDWDAIYSPRLASAAAFLHDGRTKLLRNAAEQRRASEAGGGTLTHGGGGGIASLFSPALIGGIAALENLRVRMDFFNSALHDGMRLFGDAKFLMNLSKRVLGLNVSSKLGPFAIVSKSWAVAKDGWKTVSDVRAGHYADTAFDLGHLAIDAAEFTPLGKYIDAFKVGVDIGNALDQQFHIGDRASGFIIQNVRDPNIGTRYDGPVGFGRFVTDGVGAAGHSALNFLTGGGPQQSHAGGGGW